MQEIFEKIKERFEEEHKLAEEDAERYEKGNSNHFKYAKARGYVNAMEVAIEIVNQVAEELSVAENATTNDGLISLPKVAFNRMIARMESESEKDWNDEEWFINVVDAARIVREIVKEHVNSEIPNMSDVPDKNAGNIEEFCEWNPAEISGEWNTSCKPYTMYIPFGVAFFKACPYCGKEIKVVE